MFSVGCGDEIDPRYLERANEVVGNYEGKVEILAPQYHYSHSGVSLNIELQQSMPVLNFSEDIAGKNCHSKIGKLESASLSFDQKELMADFEFDPGDCANRFIGRTLSTTLREDSKGNLILTTEILIGYKTVLRGRSSELKSIVLKGTFQKKAL